MKTIGFSSWRERDKAIIEWVKTHPSTVEILAELFFQDRRSKCYRRAQKLRKKGLLNCIGSIKLSDGRPTDVYCGWKVKEDNFHHEYYLTLFAMCYRAEWERNVRRSPFPDAVMRFCGEEYNVELHTGSMRGEKARERFHCYESETVLWVALDETGRDYLLSLAPTTNHWVACLDNIQQDPFGWVWSNKCGEELQIIDENPHPDLAASTSSASHEGDTGNP